MLAVLKMLVVLEVSMVEVAVVVAVVVSVCV
jgi:hypothetical protein